MPGLTHDQIIKMGLDENNLPSGYYRTDGGATGDLGANYNFLNQQTDNYINSLLEAAKGDKDFAIKQLAQAHDTAVGNNDPQTAQFLESVASALETKVGRIPYDYQVAVGRENTQTKTALDRLNEDEKVWMKTTEQANKEGRVSQQENLLQRGILSGTREGATGLAGSEVKTMEQKLQDQLDAYQRAKGRTTEDINTASKTTLEDLATGARRGVQDIQTQTTTGTEAAKRIEDAAKKKLEAQRALQKQQNAASAVTLNYA